MNNVVSLNLPFRMDGTNNPAAAEATAPVRKSAIQLLVERVEMAKERERDAARVVRRRHPPCGEWTCLRPACRVRGQEAPHVLQNVDLDDAPQWLMAA
jgi:hypothetical protein